jgi:hypothetical protein
MKSKPRYFKPEDFKKVKRKYLKNDNKKIKKLS